MQKSITKNNNSWTAIIRIYIKGLLPLARILYWFMELKNANVEIKSEKRKEECLLC